MQTDKRARTIKPSYIREILKAVGDPGIISLAGGLPASEYFPTELLSDAIHRVTSSSDVFQYGVTEGEPELREWVRQFHALSERDDVLITTGSQQALDLIARSYIRPGDVVLVERPSYLGALQVFELAGARVISVPQLDDGPDMEQLETQLRSQRPVLFYAVPDFHNPTGVCWSLEKRRQISELLQQHNVLFVEDAPYRELRYEGEALPQLSEMTESNSFHLGSFSKIIAPGLRVGYVSGHKTLVKPLVQIKQASDLHSSRLTQLAVTKVLEDERFPAYRKQLTEVYTRRRDALIEMIQRRLSGQSRLSIPCGGMFVWLELVDVDTDVLAKDALRQGVAVVPSSTFYPSGEESRTGLRLNFTHCQLSVLQEAVNRLAVAIDKYE